MLVMCTRDKAEQSYQSCRAVVSSTHACNRQLPPFAVSFSLVLGSNRAHTAREAPRSTLVALLFEEPYPRWTAVLSLSFRSLLQPWVHGVPASCLGIAWTGKDLIVVHCCLGRSDGALACGCLASFYSAPPGPTWPMSTFSQRVSLGMTEAWKR